jgi:nitrogen regulatory protein PII
MKLISATIRPFDWDEVRAALGRLGVYDICLTQVQTPGRGGGRAGLYRGAEYVVAHVPQARIEVAVADDMVARVIAAIDLSAGAAFDGQYTVNRLMA